MRLDTGAIVAIPHDKSLHYYAGPSETLVSRVSQDQLQLRNLEGTVLQTATIDTGPDEGRSFADLAFTLDRSEFIHVPTAARIVKYSAITLQPLWHIKLKGYTSALRLFVSANGNWIVASLSVKGKFEALLINGQTGEVAQKLPAFGLKMAISPDGRFLAVGKREKGKGILNGVDMFVDIIDVSSGRTVQRLSQARETIWDQTLHTYFNDILSTPDGNRLLTVGTSTKQWEAMRSPI
ncbi:hypothetical protein F183_A37280 [Bryobacterales bacterium F-183]|nr:hypothetical protein F183_A37280 [Bryobacterales bacterium F-183]